MRECLGRRIRPAGRTQRVAVVVPSAGVTRIDRRRALERGERLGGLTGVRVRDAEIVGGACVTGRERKHALQVGDRGAPVGEGFMRTGTQLECRDAVSRRKRGAGEQCVRRRAGAGRVARHESRFDDGQRGAAHGDGTVVAAASAAGTFWRNASR